MPDNQIAISKLNVLLVKPFMSTDEIQPPLGLGYLATTIRDRHEVSILDGIKENTSLEDFRDKIKKERPDVVCIQCYTFDKPIVREMIRIIKNIDRSIKTIIGGPEPSSNAKGVFDYFNADFGFMGEAEIGFPQLIDHIAGKNIRLEDIPSLIWKNNKRTVVNPQKFIEDLDDLNHPSWDLLRPDTYPQAPHGAFFKRMPTAPIFATRGCPYQCTFCAGFLVSGRKIRYRSVNNFVDEIEMLHKKYGINEIHIEDDNFSMKRQFVEDFCNELLRRKIDIAWACPNGLRMDTLDEELIALMKKTGLHVVSVGIESGSERILKEMKKSLTKDKIREKLAMLNRANLDLVGFFILGFPGETVEDINQTIDFACELPLKRASFMLFKPFPGTEITRKIEHELNDKDIHWENFALNKVVYSPKGMTQEQLKRLRQKALIKFYFRPRIMYSFFMSLRSFTHAKFVFKRAFKWLLN